MSVVPNRIATVSKDDFEHVLTSIYSYISIIVYLLPMYHMILRLQSEKQAGLKRYLQMIGVSRKAQIWALFVSYIAQMTVISLGIVGTMYLGGLFPKTFKKAPGLLFSFVWI